MLTGLLDLKKRGHFVLIFLNLQYPLSYDASAAHHGLRGQAIFKLRVRLM